MQETLTKTERLIYAQLVEGLTNAEIALALSIGDRTVKFHVTHILAKFSMKSRAKLIVHYYKDLLDGIKAGT